MRNKGGAPKGGRVHWLGLIIPIILHRKYEVVYNYNTHHYKMQLKTDFDNRYDEYLIVRTSEKCYRVIYFDMPTLEFEYKSFRKAEHVVDYIMRKFDKKMQREEEFAQLPRHQKYK